MSEPRPCKACKAPTTYPNGLCGRCYNLGLRGRGLRGDWRVDESALVHLITEAIKAGNVQPWCLDTMRRAIASRAAS